MKLKFVTLALLLVSTTVFSRNIVVKEALLWEPFRPIMSIEKTTERYFYFQGAEIDENNGYLPVFSKLQPLNSNEIITKVELVNPKYEAFETISFKNVLGVSKIKSIIDISYDHTIIRKQNHGIISIVPIRRNKLTGAIEKLVSFELSIQTSTKKKQNYNLSRNSKAANNSILATGAWYKFGVTKDGVYKVTYQLLQSLGMDMSAINPQNIRIYGNGGGMLPQENSEFRYDDLQENAIYVEDGNDGSFDKKDYILFYGQSQHRWKYSDQESAFTHETHLFSDTTFYFIVSDLGPGKRIVNQASSTATKTNTVSSFDAFQVHESDAINLVKSGNQWFGEVFDAVNTHDFTFSFPNLLLNRPVRLSVRVAARSKTASTFTVNADGTKMDIEVPLVSFRYPAPGGAAGANIINFTPKSSLINVSVTYQPPLSSSKGWLDYIELNGRRSLLKGRGQLSWRDTESVGNGNVSEFNLSGTSVLTQIWDVTDPTNVKNQQTASNNGNSISFVTPTSELKEFIAFDDYLEDITPYGAIDNQNLHAIEQKDMIIVAHPLFMNAANRLADFHREEGLTVVVVTPQQIYNEFSSGAQDLIGIRGFIKMFYDRGTVNDLPKYVLLFGDGSYDNKYRVSGNTNFIPTYQSNESFSLTNSYVSDDYYGLLDSNEGRWNLSESVDIGFGRLPVQTAEEADAVVDKIIRYQTAETLKDWKNTITFVGDDGDNGLHMNQSDALAIIVQDSQPVFNLDKIFLDAYQQISTPGGQRYPEAEDALDRRIEAGTFMLNYTGHGGETGWAHEQLLEISDINGWKNSPLLPLFITATCEFSRFDDPKRISGGEYILLNPEGGGIALFTTVRTVFAGDNFTLNSKLYNILFSSQNREKIQSGNMRLGDILRQTKNQNKTINTRNFTLLGDPALKLILPKHNVQTTSINGKSISQLDTVAALDKMTITGYVADQNGNKLSNYNGVLSPTIFDKAITINTLNNDDDGVFSFDLQKNKLFKGKASIKNGDFSFSFIIPKDISYEFGNGKISYYGENGLVDADANGYNNGFVIGGTSTSAAADNVGPSIDLFMNDETFIYGSITDENPILLAKLSDEHGINMVGTGLGHDIIAVLDKNTEDAVVLNDFYEADIDSYQSGSIKYPFNNLKEGKHQLTLKAWDVYNNSSEATLEFVVQQSKEIEIDNVLNYPNPFTTRTEFWFEHNQPNRIMDVKIQIFTVSGKLVKTIDKTIQNQGFAQNQLNPIVWNGRDDYGDKIGRGVYIYKLKVRSRDNGSSVEKIEKLVIL